MALSFDAASTDVVVIPKDTTIDSLKTWTICVWYNVAATANFDVLIQKPDSVGSGNRAIFMFGGDWFIRVHQTSSRCDYRTSAITTGAWEFLGCTYDDGATPRMTGFFGSLTSAATAITWDSTDDGSGTVEDDSSDNLHFGNYVDGNSGAPNADIAWIGHWDRVMTQGEIISQQFHPHVTSGCVGFWHLGWNGTGSVIDWSGKGNNSSSTTGVTLAPHVPLGPAFGFDTYGAYEVSAPAGRTTKNTRSHPLGTEIGQGFRQVTTL